MNIWICSNICFLFRAFCASYLKIATPSARSTHFTKLSLLRDKPRQPSHAPTIWFVSPGPSLKTWAIKAHHNRYYMHGRSIENDVFWKPCICKSSILNLDLTFVFCRLTLKSSRVIKVLKGDSTVQTWTVYVKRQVQSITKCINYYMLL